MTGIYGIESIERRRKMALEALKRAAVALENQAGVDLRGVAADELFWPAYEEVRMVNEAIGVFISPDRRLR